MTERYHPGDTIGPYTLIKRVSSDKWMCRCNNCGKEVDVFTTNLPRQRMCRYCRTQYVTKPKKDITNQRFGRLVALKYSGKSHWLCKCDCGKEVVVSTAHLMEGHTQSCGCYMKDRITESNSIDLSGQRFELLTVLYRTDDYISPGGRHLTQYRCRCDCGSYLDVTASNLQRGNTKSCGCMGDSYGEYTIKTMLIDHRIEFQTEYSFQDLRSPNGGLLRFDFAIVNNNDDVICLIEFHGEQHFYDEERASQTQFGQMQREVTDEIKTDYCKEHNIKLYVIRFDEDIESKMNEILEAISNAV